MPIYVCKYLCMGLEYHLTFKVCLILLIYNVEILKISNKAQMWGDTLVQCTNIYKNKDQRLGTMVVTQCVNTSPASNRSHRRRFWAHHLSSVSHKTHTTNQNICMYIIPQYEPENTRRARKNLLMHEVVNLVWADFLRRAWYFQSCLVVWYSSHLKPLNSHFSFNFLVFLRVWPPSAKYHPLEYHVHEQRNCSKVW